MTRRDELVASIAATAERMGAEGLDERELVLVDTAMDEMRRSFTLFDPYRHKRKCTIFGSARIKAGDPAYTCAVEIGAAMADAGWMVMTGAGPGIMQAGIEGAGAEDSFGIGIHLPFEQTSALLIDGDPKLLSFRYFFTRKLTFMKESHGFVLLPGGFGTLDEAFELLTLVQTGKSPLVPIVLLDPPGSDYWDTFVSFIERELRKHGLIADHDLDLIKVCADIPSAVEEITGFYRVYQRQHWDADTLVLGLSSPPEGAVVDALNVEFADLLAPAAIDAGVGMDVESTAEGAVLRVPFDRRSYARLRHLINHLNRL